MNKSINKIAAFLIFFLITTIIQAQFRMSVGPQIGLNFNLINGSDVESGGSGIGFLFAAQSDLAFNSDRTLGMLVNFSFYDNRSGSFSSTIPVPQQGFNQTQDTDLSLAYFQIEPLFKYRLPVGVYFVFGPGLGFNLSGERTVKFTNTFQNGQQQTGTAKETLKNANTRFALITGAGYDIRISQLISLAPQLTFRFGMTDIVENFALKVISFQAGVACKFHVL